VASVRSDPASDGLQGAQDEDGRGLAILVSPGEESGLDLRRRRQ